MNKDLREVIGIGLAMLKRLELNYNFLNDGLQKKYKKRLETILNKNTAVGKANKALDNISDMLESGDFYRADFEPGISKLVDLLTKEKK